MIDILIGVLLGVVVALASFLILKSTFLKQSRKDSEEMTQLMEQRIRGMMPEVLKQANDLLISTANDKLGSEKKEIKTDLENKRAEIERMIKQIDENLRHNQEKLIESDKDRISSFNVLKTRLEEQKALTEQLKNSTESLRKVLSNNQMRGEFGEQVAENLLKMSGFTKGVDYVFNKVQESFETRPDFAVLLPDGMRINVDAKFPFSNLQKMSEIEDGEEKKVYLKKFEQDVKNKIKQVTTRDYINPDDNTVDFVILFIPNEMIFSFIYDRLNEVWIDGMSKKVILAGPFTFTAILRMVKQAHQNFMYQSNIREIIKHIQTFEKEFEKFSGEFVKIGDRIRSLSTQYETVANTRSNQLQRQIDKIKLQDTQDGISLLKDDAPTQISE